MRIAIFLFFVLIHGAAYADSHRRPVVETSQAFYDLKDREKILDELEIEAAKLVKANSCIISAAASDGGKVTLEIVYETIEKQDGSYMLTVKVFHDVCEGPRK